MKKCVQKHHGGKICTYIILPIESNCGLNYEVFLNDSQNSRIYYSENLFFQYYDDIQKIRYNKLKRILK